MPVVMLTSTPLMLTIGSSSQKKRSACAAPAGCISTRAHSSAAPPRATRLERAPNCPITDILAHPPRPGLRPATRRNHTATLISETILQAAHDGHVSAAAARGFLGTIPAGAASATEGTVSNAL